MLTFLSDVLYVISHSLLAPDIIVLLLLIAYSIFSIGSVFVELLTERRHFKVVMPKFLDELAAASETDVPAVVQRSGLLRRQKTAMLTVFEHRNLSGDALIALTRRLMNQEESHYDRIVSRNNTAAKIAPMFGLVGTLVPLGPGIQALGKGDTAALSSSLLVAFDTTVAGLVAAAVCFVIAKIRQNWYDDYMSALDSAFASMVQKIEDMREASMAYSDNLNTQSVQNEQHVSEAPHYTIDESFAGSSSFDAPLSDTTIDYLFTPQPAFDSYSQVVESYPFVSMAADYESYEQPYNDSVVVPQAVSSVVLQPVVPPLAPPVQSQQVYTPAGMPANADYDSLFSNSSMVALQEEATDTVPWQYPVRR